VSAFDAFCRLAFLLAAGHALADRPLQTAEMRQEKSRKLSPGRWPFGLGVHALIHGGVVALVTGLWWVGAIETALHAAIDDAKCTGKIGLIVDQVAHMACKLAYAALVVWMMT
jgi:hypothetical protein